MARTLLEIWACGTLSFKPNDLSEVVEMSRLTPIIRRALAGIAVSLLSIVVGGAAVTQSVHPPDPPWWHWQNWIAWIHRDPQNAALLLVSALGSGGGFALTVFQVWFSRSASEAESRNLTRMERLEHTLESRIGTVSKAQKEVAQAVQGIPDAVAKQILETLTLRHYQLESERSEEVKLSRSLPPRPARCVGRREATERLRSHLLENSAAVIAFGGPGMGKSTLMNEVAHSTEAAARFGSRILFVQVEQITSTKDLLTVVSRHFGKGGESSLGETMASLGNEPSLLILDNLETLWESDALECEAQLKSLEQFAPMTALAATFRGTDIPGSVRWSLRYPVQPLTDDYDQALFLELAPNISKEDPKLAPLLAELGGVPLAIELVALESAPFDNLGWVWARWQEVGTKMAKRRHSGEGRTTSLDYSIELTLNSPSRHRAILDILEVVALLHNGLDEAMAEAVLGEAAYEAVRDLIACGLGFKADQRIQVLPPVRRYVQNHFGISEALVMLLVSAYYSLVESLMGAEGERWPALNAAVMAESENFMPILDYACTRLDQRELVNQGEKVLEYYKEIRGRFDEFPDPQFAPHIRFLRAYEPMMGFAQYRATQAKSYKDLTRAGIVGLGIARLKIELMKTGLYRQLKEMDDICATCEPEVREDTEPKLARLRQIYDDYFSQTEPEVIQAKMESQEPQNAWLKEYLDPYCNEWAENLEQLCREHKEQISQVEEMIFAKPPKDGLYFKQAEIDDILRLAPQRPAGSEEDLNVSEPRASEAPSGTKGAGSKADWAVD